MYLNFKIYYLYIATVILLVLISCNNSEGKGNEDNPEVISFAIKNLSDTEYPDNPDIGFRSNNYQSLYFTSGSIQAVNNKFTYNLRFFSKHNDTLLLENIDISEFIPTIPEHIKGQEYMQYISCINQEWNRNQIQFRKGEFSSSNDKIVRVDIARNCLSAYLWEIILYIKEDDKTIPYAHGWFDFPHNLYAKLFEKKNNLSYTTFKKPLEEWIDPESKTINRDILREIIDSIKIQFKDLSDEMYPLEGARKKKFKEIIYPKEIHNMKDLQSDSTLFATFTPPGFYNTKEPRTTELGRIYNLEDIHLYRIKNNIDTNRLYEIELLFKNENNKYTKLLIGGLNLNDFPKLEEKNANKGWKNSMGIGNHSFYETYQYQLSHKSQNSPYYALLLDKDDKWLDSHKIGIDGPIFHLSEDEKTLHLWLLSFERHALVGHYEISLIEGFKG